MLGQVYFKVELNSPSDTRIFTSETREKSEGCEWAALFEKDFASFLNISNANNQYTFREGLLTSSFTLKMTRYAHYACRSFRADK